MRTPVSILLVACFATFAGAAPRAQAFPNVHAPNLNPITPAKTLLGKSLFWDEQLSSTGTMACGTCHMPEAGGTDPRVLFPAAGATGTVNPGPDGVFGNGDDRVASLGVPSNLASGGYTVSAWGLGPQVTGRKSPSMINAVFAGRLFWDGRADDTFHDPITGAVLLNGHAALESQAAGPPVSDVEMGHAGVSWTLIQNRIATVQPLALASNLPPDVAAFVAGQDYPSLFLTAFGSPGVTAARIAMAIATYERTLVSADSRFDRWNGGQNPEWLTAQEVAGRNVFFGPGNCNQCHNQPAFTDHNFHDLGVRPESEDLGRGAITGQQGDRRKFKTPTLRNVALQRHFMHNGGFATLADVVDFYNRGGDFPGAQIAPLGLSAQQRADLVAFLQTLTDDRVANRVPPFDRPALYSESTRVPQSYGHGTVGSGGFVPDLRAIEPPMLGNARWTIGVERAFGASIALLMADVAPAPAGGFPVLGVQVFLGATPQLLAIGAIWLDGTGPGQGTGSAVVPMPAVPQAIGLSLYMQWFAIDFAGADDLTASEAVALTIF